MAYVNPQVGQIVEDLPGTGAAVEAARDRLAAIAEGLFASHDEPGGHEIVTHNDPGSNDAFVDFIGPAPLAVEFGHWTPDHDEFVEGLHVLSRAINQAEVT